MQSLRNLTAYAFTLLLVAVFVSPTSSAPKGSFQRRNWTPHSIMYLKGTQGRRFIPEGMTEGDIYDAVHLETRSQNVEKVSVSQAASILLNFLLRAKEEEGESELQAYPPGPLEWKQDYF